MTSVKPDQASAAKLPDGMTVKAPTVDLSGQRFGLLVAIDVVGKHSSNSLLWRCLCDCGNETIRPSSRLRNSTGVSSCGCYLAIISGKRLSEKDPWNKGKRYTRNNSETYEYRTKGSWADAVRLKSGNSCEKCGWDKARCDVHHIVHKKDGGKNIIGNGIVLCPNCHRVEHDNDNIKRTEQAA